MPNPSTVTRYVQRYPELGVSVDGQTKVWRDKYLAHRSDNPAATPAPQMDLDTPAPRMATVTDLPARAAKGKYEEARAQLVELELAEKLGQLVKADDVRSAVAAAAQGLRDGLLTPDMEFAERLLACDGMASAAAMIVRRNREMLSRFVEQLAAQDT